MKNIPGWLGMTAVLLRCAAWASAHEPIPTQSQDLVRQTPEPMAFQVQSLVRGLSHPWSLAWLPSGVLLITEREGRLRRVSRDFQFGHGAAPARLGALGHRVL